MIFISLNNVGEHGLNVRRIAHEDMFVFSEYLAIECGKAQHKKIHASIANRIAPLCAYHKKTDDPMTPVINMNLGIVAIAELYRLAAAIVARLAAVSQSNVARYLNDPNRKSINVVRDQPEFDVLPRMMDILDVFSFCMSVGTSVTLSQQATPKLARVH